MRIFAVIILSIVILVGCTAVVKDGTEKTVEYADALDELEAVEEDWQMAVMRGDGESAPTYAEFMLDMGVVGDDLRDIVSNYKLSEDLEGLINEFLMTLVRGDAELAPSYEEALEEATDYLYEFSAMLDEMR